MQDYCEIALYVGFGFILSHIVYLCVITIFS